MTKIVIALGGNAILKKGERPTIKTQERNVKAALEKMKRVIGRNEVVITHGNGPQIGYLLMQQPGVGLDVLDAESGGQIGYLIQQNLQNILEREVVTMVTQVLVDAKDGAFRNPAKFIGPFYKSKEQGVKMKRDPRGGWRRVVASPKPLRVIEKNSVEYLLRKGVIVIAVGGGGIPVVKKSGKLDGVEAVIDKDLASACLANSINADTLVMITDVDRAYLNFGKNNEKGIGKVRVKEIKQYFDEGHFGEGSMKPKIEAAINFIEGGGEKVIITNSANIEKAMKEKEGTVIVG